MGAYDSEEGIYPEDEELGIDKSRFGICRQCGREGYLFGKLELIIDDDGYFFEYDICTDCAKEVIDEFRVDSEGIDN